MSDQDNSRMASMFGAAETESSDAVNANLDRTLPLFKYHFDVSTVVLPKPSAHSATQDSRKSTSDANKVASIATLAHKKLFLMDRCKYYSLTIEKLLDSNNSTPDHEAEEDNTGLGTNGPKYYARLRLGIPDEKLRKVELELVKNWALQHRAQRMIELQPEEEATPEQHAGKESKSSHSRARSNRTNKAKDVKRSRSQAGRTRKQQQQQETAAKEVATCDEPSVTDQMARNLTHDAYLNQCVVLLDFTPDSEYDTSVEQTISFRLNCVSSQFPEEHRAKLAIILETYAYQLSATGVTSRRVDLAYFPVTIFWTGGSQRRTQQDQLSLLKDDKLEQLHDSIQPCPLHLPPSYWTTVSGKGYFASILEAATTYGRKDQDLSWTYLDRGQSYMLRLKNLNFLPGTHPVKLRTTIKVSLNTATEVEELASWPLINPDLGPMLEVDYAKSSLSMDPPVVVQDITRPSSGNSLTLLWVVSRKTEEEVKVALQFNFLSAHFLANDKDNYRRGLGQPATLSVETFNDSFEGQSRKIDSASCMIIVLEPGQSQKQLLVDYDRICLPDSQQPYGKNTENLSPAPSPPSSPVACYALQPSYSSTLLRTSAEFIVKLILFISIEKENNYHPLFLHHFDVSHFRESLDGFLRKWLPPNGTNEREPLGEILVVGLPDQSVKYSQIGVVLTAELIATRLKSKSIYQCLFHKDSMTRRGETDVKLVFQADHP